jgi:arsenate reductase (thioredoxin)
MAERGIDISRQASKTLEPFVNRKLDYVITVCDRANQSCPTFPQARHRLHWPFPDPGQAQGGEAERLAVFRDVSQGIETRLRTFAAVELAS